MKNDSLYFPLFVDLREKKIVVIGAGTIALRRVKTLMDFSDHITVIAPDMHPEFKNLEKCKNIQLLHKEYQREMILDADMVLAATDNAELNQEIYGVCKCLGILVNVCSDKTKCDFYFPGIVKQDSVVVGITASGKNHGLAKEVRNKIETCLRGEEKMKICVGSRESKLAVIQSEMVIEYLKRECPEAEISLLTMKTTGDIILDRTLDKIGGKGLFVKELDRALIEKRSDLSVHSLKDMPMEIPSDLPLLAFSKREDPRDVLVLPEGSKELDLSKPIGCSSLRRTLQFKELYPQAEFKPVRGNVLTRLKKLDNGEYGGLLLAAAGLKRLGLEKRIYRYFEPEEIIPAAGQGILAVQGRANEDYHYLKNYNDKNSYYTALAERAFVRYLDGGCSSPVAAHGRIEGDQILLLGLYYDDETGCYRKGSIQGDVKKAETLGIRLAEELKEQVRREKNGR